MAWQADSEGVGIPAPPGRGFRSRSRKRRRESSPPSPSTSAAWSELPGVFAVHKPAGVTSHDVVARVRRALDGAKVGHAGTLDPDATGVLVLCVGKATKISAYLMEGEKEYRGVGRLGVTTDTQDSSGSVLSEREVSVTPAELRAASERFVGRIEQIPPMFSAVKIDGQKLYRLARKGIEVDRPPRSVVVHAFDLGEVRLPEFEFTLRCSKGTYVRTVVHDLGEELGCGAHLVRLARTRQGGFRSEDALAWEVLHGTEAADAIRGVKRAPDEALDFAPLLPVPSAAEPLRVGAMVPVERPGEYPDGLVRLVVSGDRVAGIGRIGPDGLRILHLLPPGSTWGRGRRGS